MVENPAQRRPGLQHVVHCAEQCGVRRPFELRVSRPLLRPAERCPSPARRPGSRRVRASARRRRCPRSFRWARPCPAAVAGTARCRSRRPARCRPAWPAARRPAAHATAGRPRSAGRSDRPGCGRRGRSRLAPVDRGGSRATWEFPGEALRMWLLKRVNVPWRGLSERRVEPAYRIGIERCPVARAVRDAGVQQSSAGLGCRRIFGYEFAAGSDACRRSSGWWRSNGDALIAKGRACLAVENGMSKVGRTRIPSISAAKPHFVLPGLLLVSKLSSPADQCATLPADGSPAHPCRDRGGHRPGDIVADGNVRPVGTHS